MLKYNKNNKYAIVDEPSIWKISKNLIIVTTVSGTDIVTIPQNSSDYTIQVGNIDPIRTGGTTKWGRDKMIIPLAYTAGSSKTDSVLVLDITVCPTAGEGGWCTCTKNGMSLTYKAIQKNPTGFPRYAYFKHKTTNGFLTTGEPVYSEWWVTVMQEANPKPDVIKQSEGTTPETPDDPTLQGDVKCYVTIQNNSGEEKTIGDTICFIIANGSTYSRIKGTLSNNSNFTIPNGSNLIYDLTFEDNDGQTPKVLIGKSFAQEGQRSPFKSNVAYYIGTDGYTCEEFDSSVTFEEGVMYNIIIPSNTEQWMGEDGEEPTIDPGTDPTPGGDDPVNPDAGNPVISINVNITNNTSSSVALDGRLRFVLGNPDHNGNYFGGYTGLYIRTDSLYFSSSAVTIAPGETQSYSGLSWRDGDTGLGLGETSPLSPSLLPIFDDKGDIAYAGNILMYTNGRSDVTLCENLSSSTVFQEGGTYDIIIKQA